MNIIRPSLTLLPMEDIAAELKSDKSNRKFMTRDDKAKDVEQVSGIDAENIAVAVSPTNRTTIENALNLAGIPAEEYLNKTEGEKILGIANVMSQIYSSEIRNLRDELYQVQSQLSKRGFIDDVTPYEGFHDAFKKSNKKYEGYICGISRAIIGNTEELYIADLSKKELFEKGKRFVIKRHDLDTEVVVKSEGITASGKVTFYPTVNILDSLDAVGLYKSTGEYVKDSFSFSEVKKDVANPLKERYHMQSDDTRTAFKVINESGTGYAAYFKVPNAVAGALTKFGIRAKVEGTPGSIVCHILKKEAIYDANNNFKVSFKNIEEAKDKNLWIATSQPIQSSEAAVESEVYFDFFDVSTNKYPILQGTQYVFIIECLSATEYDYWKIRFSYFSNAFDEVEDLQKYNNAFYFEAQDPNDITNTKDALQVIDNIDKYDMLFTLVTRELIEEDEMGKQEGVYTAKILLPKPIEVSRMRLTSRINREGCYYVESHNDTYTIFNLVKETSTSHSVADIKLKEDDIIIIGNQIAKVARMSGNQLEVKEPVYIDSRVLKFYAKTEYNGTTGDYETVTRIPVYRMNYDISVKPSLIDWEKWDDVERRFATTDLCEEPMKLELMSVLPDGHKKNRRISDRLLFEGDFGRNDSDIANIANHFELQIHWKSPFSYDEINDFKDLNDNQFKELIGRIHDLVLSFDKNY